MTIFKKSFVLVFLCLVFSHSTISKARAACTGGEVAGTLGFDMDGSGEYKYCNGTIYVPMKVGLSIGLCSKAGEMYFDGGLSTIVWCDGTNLWSSVVAGGIGGCGLTAELLTGGTGSLQYGTLTNTYYLCDGLGWLPIL